MLFTLLYYLNLYEQPGMATRYFMGPLPPKTEFLLIILRSLTKKFKDNEVT